MAIKLSLSRRTAFTLFSQLVVFHHIAIPSHCFDSASVPSVVKSNYSEMATKRYLTYNPYAPGIAEKYGLPGSTDPEGFDPYADTVGAGIYGGSVERDEVTGEVKIGKQYQNHNERPGPIYDGKGYSLMSKAIHTGPEKVKEILDDFPELVNEISTGGATPLHVCGMSRRGQLSTEILINRGANIHALDTYGMNALHRMASNDLAIGGEVLVKAGLDPNYIGFDESAEDNQDYSVRTPNQIARQSRSINFLMTMQKLGMYD